MTENERMKDMTNNPNNTENNPIDQTNEEQIKLTDDRALKEKKKQLPTNVRQLMDRKVQNQKFGLNLVITRLLCLISISLNH